VELLALIGVAALLSLRRAGDAPGAAARVVAQARPAVSPGPDGPLARLGPDGPLARLGLTRTQAQRLGGGAATVAAHLALLPAFTFLAVTAPHMIIPLSAALRLGAQPVGMAAGDMAYTGEEWRPGAILANTPDMSRQAANTAIEQAVGIARLFGVPIPADIHGYGLERLRAWLVSSGVPPWLAAEVRL
jgi:hypothetical protein